jgi:hypothetical protein
MIVLNGEGHEHSNIRKFVRQRGTITSFGDLHDYMDANMLPPQAEWLLGRPLVVQDDDADQFHEDGDGQQLAVDVLNAAQDEVDAWIKEGKLAELGHEMRKETEPYGV